MKRKTKRTKISLNSEKTQSTFSFLLTSPNLNDLQKVAHVKQMTEEKETRKATSQIHGYSNQ